MAQAVSKQRLDSLDALRGFDLFVLVALGPLVQAFVNAAGSDEYQGLRDVFTHVSWEGFAPWDLVMPLFVFMAGASIPFALARYRGGANRGGFVWRLLRRVVLLWLLGMVVQGNLLSLDPSCFYLYTNTLQAIAAGYLIAALLFVNTRIVTQIVVALVLLLGYWAVMEWVSVDGYGGGNYRQVSRRSFRGGRWHSGVLALLSLHVDFEHHDIRSYSHNGCIRRCHCTRQLEWAATCVGLFWHRCCHVGRGLVVEQ